MANQETDETKNVRKKDLVFISSMLAIYAVCCMLAIAGSAIWIKRDREIISANATATQAVIVTEQANATATVVAHLVDQDQYKYVEHFDKVTGLWFTGEYNKPYADVQVSIEDGAYIWDIKDSKSSTQSTDFHEGNTIKDFDLYVDLKLVENPKEQRACGGIFFRRPYSVWSGGSYIFLVCNGSYYQVLYYGKNGWQTITYSGNQDLIKPLDWNRLEITARGSEFTFTINNVQVFEMTDDRLKQGSLGLFMDLGENGSAEIWFDNFGYQPR